MTEDPIDQHIGKCIETLRVSQRLTLQAIADELGITYQQVRKYENAQNRISASTLYRLSQALGVQPSFFFEGLNGTASDELTNEKKQTLPSTEEQLLERVENAEVRAALRHLFERLHKVQLPSKVSAPRSSVI